MIQDEAVQCCNERLLQGKPRILVDDTEKTAASFKPLQVSLYVKRSVPQTHNYVIMIYHVYTYIYMYMYMYVYIYIGIYNI